MDRKRNRRYLPREKRKEKYRWKETEGIHVVEERGKIDWKRNVCGPEERKEGCVWIGKRDRRCGSWEGVNGVDFSIVWGTL